MRDRLSKGFGKGCAICIALVAFSVTASARADGDEAPPITFELATGGIVIVHGASGERVVPLGCIPQSFTSLGNQAYALCTPSTVVMVTGEGEPRVVERRVLAERILSLTVASGTVSARSAAGLKPLEDYAVGPAPPTPKAHVLSLRAPDYRTLEPRPVAPDRTRGLEIMALGTAGTGVANNQIGGAGWVDASIAYRFSIPLVLAGYGTLGGASGNFDPGSRTTNPPGPVGGDVQMATWEAIIGLDSRFIAFGGGAGVALIEKGYDVAPLLVLRGRFGERDRFEVDWHMAFAMSGPTAIGSFGGVVEFQVTPKWWIGADAEFGNLRHNRFMFDVRRRVAGDGGRGTLDLRVGLGLTYVQTSSSCDNAFSTTGDTHCLGTNAEYVGPALSFGVVWRP